ncbi:serine/threonine-protein phosphatase 6 regulatory ankyrin repeat subunit B-like [Haliotis rubra]|uniref:serine/threonine-protein phosphatase 6 regulatory ankyrin repeat subunit B-like n=1 Tax=Haliotis rubra TaxID=36100 RepID=UPI001EE55A34|nr:serine/threonine-protein phosphatase 6 regulatory ankyrin repeat subunit B-like [Haliotis rubra]XP_046566179.1 serine/threonine-protein phosphatase 6 regulatory ankyrin repeat subunit B-like [Haliotis rubra]
METNDDLNLQMLVAAQQGDLDRLTEILDTGIDINSQDLMFSETAVVAACRYGCTDIVKFLVSKGANVNIQTKNGGTGLHVAVINSKIPCLEFLLTCPDIMKDVHDDLGMTPIMVAAHRGHHKVMAALIKYGCRLDTTNNKGKAAIHLTQLPYQGHVGHHDGFQCLKHLTDAGVDINTTDHDGMTPLHYAIKGGNFAAVKWLVSENCDLDRTANPSVLQFTRKDVPLPVTPLSVAVFYFNARVVKLLLAVGLVKQRYSNIISYSENNSEIRSLLSEMLQIPESLKNITRRTIRKKNWQTN